jgi:HPt (histidine-containing phosphotransfer) domain-containing protein
MVFGREYPGEDGANQVLMTYDPGRLESVCNGNEALRRRILTEYALTTPPLVTQLLQYLDAGNADEAGHIAHTLKGSSRTIGGIAFGDLCNRIELQTYDLAMTDVRDQIEAEFGKLCKAIDGQLGVELNEDPHR